MKKALKITAVLSAGLLILIAINFIPMISLKVPGMKRYQYDGVIVYAMEKDRDNVSAITGMINGKRALIDKALNSDNSEDVEVIIYPDRKALHLNTLGFAGWFLPDWYIGKNTRDAVLITSPSEPGPAHDRESIEKAAVHEYVHVLTDRINRKLGYWYKEAFALYLAEQKPGALSPAGAEELTYRDFKTEHPLRFAEIGGYTLAYHYMDYLVRTFGWDKVVGLLEPGRTCEDVLGIKEPVIFEQWKNS